MKALAPAGLCAAALLWTGCATVWSRGIVQNGGGESIQTATVQVLEGGDAKPVATISVDRNGCFMVGPFVAKGEHRFTLEISAPGFKPSTYDFELQTPILVATLVPTSSEAPSEIRPADASERENTWMPLCVPPTPQGASQLSP